MKYIYIFALLVQGPLFAERIKFVHKPQLSFDEQSKKWHVKFEMDSLSDVEVAMVARWLDDYPSSCRGVLGPPALRRYDVDGNYLRTLFPKAPSGTPQTYDVLFGAFETKCITRSPRSGVDGYGRIYYPTNIAQRVSVVDNAGNEILHFGTYGNRDSMGRLPGDKIPIKGVPLAFPNSIDATDNYVYVADMVNLRLLRLKKIFEAIALSRRNL